MTSTETQTHWPHNGIALPSGMGNLQTTTTTYNHLPPFTLMEEVGRMAGEAVGRMVGEAIYLISSYVAIERGEVQ